MGCGCGSSKSKTKAEAKPLSEGFYTKKKTIEKTKEEIAPMVKEKKFIPVTKEEKLAEKLISVEERAKRIKAREKRIKERDKRKILNKIKQSKKS
jgi:hypothetical protein